MELQRRVEPDSKTHLGQRYHSNSPLSPTQGSYKSSEDLVDLGAWVEAVLTALIFQRTSTQHLLQVKPCKDGLSGPKFTGVFWTLGTQGLACCRRFQGANPTANYTAPAQPAFSSRTLEQTPS